MIRSGMLWEQIERGELASPKWHSVLVKPSERLGLDRPLFVNKDFLGLDETPRDREIFRYPHVYGEYLYWMSDEAVAILGSCEHEIIWDNRNFGWVLDIKDPGVAMLFKLTFGGVV